MAQQDKDARKEDKPKKIGKGTALIVILIVAYGVFKISSTPEDAPPPAQPAMEQRAAAAEKAIALDPDTDTPEAEQSREQARAAIAANTETVKPEIADLLKRLEALRQNPEFHQRGFSSPQGKAWQQDTESLRDRIQKDNGIALEARAAPGYLLGLAWEWIRHQGAMTDDAAWDMQMIEDALNWKPED